VEFRPRATHPGFSYSSAMKAKGGDWSYDEIFRFLKSPGAYIPGTKMSFAGLKSAQDRINLIAYLRTQSDSPPPIPAPAPAKAAAAPAAAAPAAAAPAAGDKTPGHGQPAAPAPKTP
jgi:cytochrome c